MDAQGSGISSFTSGNLCLQSSDGSGISGFTLFSSSLSFRGRSVLGFIASQSASITLDAISALDSQDFVTTMVTDVNVTLAGPVVIATAGADGVLIAPGAIGNSGGNFTVLRDFNVLARSGRSSGGSTVALVGAGRSVVLTGVVLVGGHNVTLVIRSGGAAVAGIVALVVALIVGVGDIALVVILAVIGSGCSSG